MAVILPFSRFKISRDTTGVKTHEMKLFEYYTMIIALPHTPRYTYTYIYIDKHKHNIYIHI